MRLTESGESRVRGYLYVFERSLRSFLAPAIAADAVREVESHIRDAVTQAPDARDERDALEHILQRLGPPMKVAQAYSLELMMDEAAATGRVGAVVRSLFHLATSGIVAFFGALGLFVGYAIGVSFMIVGIAKLILPNNVGFWMRNGIPISGGLVFGPRGDAASVTFVTTYWIVPIALGIGLVVALVTHALARRWIAWLRRRRRRSFGD